MKGDKFSSALHSQSTHQAHVQAFHLCACGRGTQPACMALAGCRSCSNDFLERVLVWCQVSTPKSGLAYDHLYCILYRVLWDFTVHHYKGIISCKRQGLGIVPDPQFQECSDPNKWANLHRLDWTVFDAGGHVRQHPGVTAQDTI